MSALVCARPGCGHGEDLHDGLCFDAVCECVRFVEPMVGVADAVRVLGALPVPQGPELSERDRLRAAYVEALESAHLTHPCPQTGRPYWTGCVHYDKAGHVAGVGSCHSGRRADAVLAVRDVELERLRAQVAQLLAERHVTNEALDDAVQALRARRSLTEAETAAMWATVDEATPGHIFRYEYEQIVRAALGAVGIPLADGDRADESADKLTALLAPSQALREDATAAPCCHLHKPSCCDPEDCGPCCMDCPTCPVLVRQRTAESGGA